MSGTRVVAKLDLEGVTACPRQRGAAAHAMLPGGFQLGVALGAMTAHEVLAALGTEVDDPTHRERSPTPLAAGGRTGVDRRSVGFASSTFPRGLSLWNNGGLTRRKPEVRLGIQNPGDGLRIQVDRRLPVLVQEAKIRIRACGRRREFGLNAGRLGSGQSSLSGTQPHDRQLIVFAGLDLQRPSVGSIRHDRVAQLGHLDRPTEPSRVDRGKVMYQLTKESLQVHRGFSRLGSRDASLCSACEAHLSAGFVLAWGKRVRWGQTFSASGKLSPSATLLSKAAKAWSGS